jgi:hypothetical protein
VSNPERIITSLGTLFRALSHLIRGDLSVISNDLTFLSTVLPEGEVERAKNRCNSIISTLHSLQLLKDSNFQQSKVTVQSLFEEACPGIQVDCKEEYSVLVDPTLTKSVISHLISVFLQKKEGPFYLYRRKDGNQGDNYWISDGRHSSEAAQEFLTLDLLSGASQILGESSMPSVALCELILEVQGANCQVVMSPQGREVLALTFMK